MSQSPPSSRPEPSLLEVLICPQTKGRLTYDAERQELISKTAGLAYPIHNGVPLLTRDAARQLKD